MAQKAENRPHRGRQGLADWLQRRGYSYSRAGRELGIDRATLHKIASGVRRPTLDQALAIWDAAGVSPRDWAER